MSRVNLVKESGMALVTTIVIVMILMGLGMTFSHMSFAGYESSRRDEALVRARLAAEEGLHRASAELLSDVDPGGDGLGTLTLNGADGRSIQVTATDLGGGFYSVRSRAELSRATFAAESVVQVYSKPLSISTPGAIVAMRELEIEEPSTIIDGRDWDFSGTTVIGPGVPGAYCMEDVVDLSDQALVGGAGSAPAYPPPPGSIVDNAIWADGVDDDGDGFIDEEAFDGIDNDGDGLIDEDNNSFPTSADVALHLPDGTLKAFAQAAGTYFTSEALVEAYIAANGGNVPGGVIIYLDSEEGWDSMDLGPLMNDVPSIIVCSNPDDGTELEETSGVFKGLIFCDDFEPDLDDDQENETFELLGALISWGEVEVESEDPGGIHIRYSSEVLTSLPAAIGGQPRIRRLTWRRTSVNL